MKTVFLLCAAVALPIVAEAIDPLPHCSVKMSYEDRCDSVGQNGTPFVPGVNCRQMVIDSFPRQYLVFVPTSQTFDATQPTPLVFLIHGSGQDGPTVLSAWKWVQKAEEIGLILVAPTALPAHETEKSQCRTKWNAGNLEQKIFGEVKPRLEAEDGTLVQEYPDRAPFPADDVGFVRAMGLDVVTHLNIDPGRIYVTGFSNGASFTGRLTLEMPEFFAATHMSGSSFRVDPADLGPYPTRYISVRLTMGQCEKVILDSLGIPATDCLSEGRNGLPMDPVEFMAHGSASEVLSGQATMFGLDPTVYDAVEMPSHTTYEFKTPLPGNSDGNVYRATILPRMGHTYPKRHGAEWVWDFFEERAR